MKKNNDNIEETDKKHYNRTQTCRNCGVNGHLYKDCIHPIMSFGIICFKKDENNQIKYIMIQRKDSLSFMEFIRGKYNTNDIIYIRQLISAMTLNEKKILISKQFDDIWNYAWNQNNNTSIKHTTEYIDSENKFEYLSRTNILNEIIKDIINLEEQEQEWGFPKGRRKVRENDIDCAIREFCEETRLEITDFKILTDILPFEEIFFGTNNVLYKHTYYVAKIVNNSIKISVDENCIEQIREVRDLNWFSYEEVINHIKIYNIERHQIIQRVNDIIKIQEKIV